MAEPTYTIVERIARAIKLAVEAVKESSGYSVTIASCTRPGVNGLDRAPGHLEALLIQDDTSDDEASSASGNPPLVAKVTPFVVFVAIREVSADECFDQLVNEIGGALMKSLAADCQWGGLAIDSIYSGPDIATLPDGQGNGLAIGIDVTYRTPQNNPYSVA